LQIIDEQDKRMPGRDACHQLAERRKCTAPKLLRVGDFRRPLARIGDHLDPAENREQAHQRQHVPWKKRLGHGLGKLSQVPAQCVDKVVERLIRHRLALEATAGKHHGIDVAFLH
jgi:hypothetical protein